ncbi:transmembrane emp24 domain-containing protein p24beta3-like [Hibiscus syriacus]|uniref:Transmembrane emp24 domain-containing protein p24beta3-like n=1 Tax=Hibiscus syriacus TaxID=106335 RepID=A0A6A2ZKG1_HIBSY|nr:protein SPIRRIG-like isoform X2 [Hibiscus syriacus]KAE8692066.1 transmembrane emp24 domain-containing protein p24beta3-like [Hibiscus syriacus]
MKWVSLLKDIKEKVGLAQSPTTTSTATTVPSSSYSSSNHDTNASSTRHDYVSSPSRDKHELELDFKRFWEEFRSSNSEKEKEAALNLTIDVFCRLVKQHSNVAQLVTLLVETHIFSFVVGRAFVTDIEKLKISSKTRSLDVLKVLRFFSEFTEGGFSPGSNLLTAVEILVSGPIDKQSLLDSGIFCCLVHILNSLLSPDQTNQRPKVNDHEDSMLAEKDSAADVWQARKLEVEGSVVHIMKALASHPSAAQSLIEDDSLMLLFQMVANGSIIVFSRYKEGLVSLHIIQLHRHAMQILGLLLINDNGSTAKYIHKFQLIKVLLMAVKDFNPDCGDPAYTVGIVDLLLECVELSYRPEASGVSLREDIRNAHGYHFLVQFVLVLSSMPQKQGIQSIYLKLQVDNDRGHSFDEAPEMDCLGKEDPSSEHLSPTLTRLLDILVNLAQTGPAESKTSKHSRTKAGSHSISQASSTYGIGDKNWEQENNKVKDLEAVQMLQDIFLKAESRDLQAEVLNRVFKIFSSDLENYKLCQQLRIVPLLILNMAGFPPALQEIILKILEYAVTVVNCVPEQELLSLCCLLQQPIASELKFTILSFFVKLLSFDQQYKKVLREVGVLEVLLDDLKQHKFLLGSKEHGGSANELERKSSSSSFQKHLDKKDVIITSPMLIESGSGKFPIFEVESTVAIGWDCMVSLVKKAEANQAAFRAANGLTTVLPFLVSNIHRPGVLRILSCLITEDVMQGHPEELGSLVEVLKSGMVTSDSGHQYKLQSDAKCDTMGALWRILGVNNAAQRVFGEATGFSILLTSLHSFQGDGHSEESSLLVYIKVFTYLLRLMTAGVCGNAINRTKLHAIISSQTFYDLLSESGLLCVDYEKQVIHLLLELALEVVLQPFMAPEGAIAADMTENESTSFLLSTPSGMVNPNKERIYNAGAVRVLIRSLLLFTPKVQVEVLDLIGKLAGSGPFNQENLTSVGCVELLLETIQPFLSGSSPLLSYALKIVEVLGAYRLSASELQALVRYILQMRLMKSGYTIVDMMERLILMEDTTLENVPLAPFVEMDMSKIGHASVLVSMGERSWPPAAGYSFVCWFQFQNFLRMQAKETDPAKAGPSKRKSGSNGQHHDQNILRIFSVGAVNNENTFYAELYLQEDGVLTLATSNSCSLSFSGLELEEGRWHHLAVVHSKPNALAGLFQASVAYIYLDGKLRHTGKLGYSPSPIGKPLQVTIGTPVTRARVSDFTWRLRSCYLFEEVLTPGCICVMYILGRGYRGLFQDADLLRFVPNQACGGCSMAILDSLDADLSVPPGMQKLDNASKQENTKADGSGIVWELDRLGNLSLQLSGKKLIFAFDGTCAEAVRASGTSFLLNLVDPLSAAASPIGGIPRFGRLNGDNYFCRQCVMGDTIRPIGGMSVILALVEAAETRDMLHMALSFLACSLHHNPQNVRDMQTYRGYHLLALFLRRRMSLFNMQCLEIFFQIAACEASFSEPNKLKRIQTSTSPTKTTDETGFEELNFGKFRDETSSVGSLVDMDDFSAPKDSFSHISGLENADMPIETSNCIVLSNADMVEHVLLDWTLWVTAPVSIQISLLNFLEHLVSMHWYRNHNLTVLRRINLVQHLLVTLQRGDVEVPVLEKLVVLLGVILEDGFLASELENVVRFVIMTFDPPELKPQHQILRESIGKHVIVRNMLLEMLIDLQVTIKTEEMLEQWHKIVSSKLITYFLDEAVHPTSMRWIMTLLGVCLASSSTFALKFRTSGGYQRLMRVLPSFYDSPDIYYILFCLIFGKPVYPRLPEVRMLDFHALMPSDGGHVELKFVELLESVIAMAKSTFDRLSIQSILARQTGNISQLVAELVEENVDMAGELQGEALMHKTYAALLMGGEASAPAAATSVLRFMVDLAKMCPPFSAVCKRAEFLESCVDLYFSCVRSAHTVKMARELSAQTEERILNDCDDASSQNTFSSLPVVQEQSAKTSISAGSFPQAQVSSSSEEMPVTSNFMAGDKEEMKHTTSQEELKRSMPEDVQVIRNVEGDQVSATSSSNEFIFHGIKDNLAIQPPDSQSSASLAIPDSPILSEKSNYKIPLSPSSSPIIGLTSWLSLNQNESHNPTIASPSMDSSINISGFDQSSDLNFDSQGPTAANLTFSVTANLLLETDDSGYGGGPCSAGATAMLDFIAEVLADFLTEQIKAAQVVESILEMVPLYVEAESMLVFQGLVLTRLMNFVERRLVRDDEEDGKKLDKNKWSSNLDALCWMIVDRVYMGALPQPAGVLKTLEFLLSMLQLANKDGRIEEAVSTGKGLLSIAIGSRQLDAYVHSILKNTNRMIMYCFLPSFLITIGEDDLLSSLGVLMEHKKKLPISSSQEDPGTNISTVLQLIVAHRRIVFCPSNFDTDLNCCLCVNLISLLRDLRQNVQNMAIDVVKYLLVHRRASLEDLLISKPNQGQHMDVLHGGFDKLLTGSLSAFFDWFQKSEQMVNRVLEQCAAIMWVQYIAGSAKFPGVRIKGMEGRRKREMGRRSRDTSKVDLKHWENVNERRYALVVLRDTMSTELRVIRQDKYGWVLHAESEWQNHLQQLVHERGIFPIRKSSVPEDPQWQLCPIEGPYRMRKKLERCKLKIDSIQNVLDWQLELGETEFSKVKHEGSPDVSDSDSEVIFNLLNESVEQNGVDTELYDESLYKESDDVKDVTSVREGWNDDRASSVTEASLHSALEFGGKSSVVSVPVSESIPGKSEYESPRQSSSVRIDEVKVAEDKSDKELNDNGEYLIRPYLEPLEKIRFRYNCERVVGLDKHDGIFLIGELCLYVIENFYINSSGCICEKECEDELSVIDQALGVKKDVTGCMDFQSKSTSSCASPPKILVGGRAWAYNGGAWGKEKMVSSGNLPHAWRMWKLDSVHEILKRDYQLRPVAVELFSMDGCNDLLVFHKRERDEVFKNLVAMNLPRNSMLDTTISGSTKQESNEGGRLFKITAKSFSKRWQNGEISNFQYLMHLNTLAGRGYSDLTQYPVFPWVLADYESENLDMSDTKTFRKLDKPMGCQTPEGEGEFKKRYESWDDPEVPKFHYGSHYSSAGIVLFYLLRLPPFSVENQKLQGGQFDHADRLFNCIRDTWLSAAGKGNTSDVKELIPEFFYMPEFLENRFNLDLGEKQSGEKVGDVLLPPWAKGSARVFIRKHREALESDFVSENLHHWIDLIFGYKQRGKAAEEAVNVFYHYTYEGSVDIDSVSDPSMKASILAQINHFGQTPKQLFLKPHVKRRTDRKLPPHPLKHSAFLVPHEIRKSSSSITQIVTFNEKILVAGKNTLLKPRTHTKYVAWGFSDRSLRFMSYDQDRLLSTHENLHGGNQIQCAGVSHDGHILVTGADDGLVSVWRISEDGPRALRRLLLEKVLCGHTAKITCLRVCQPYMLFVSGSDDCTVILWDLSSLVFVRQLPEFPAPVSAVYVNDLSGEIVTAAGILLAVWSINGDCLAVISTSQLPSDCILSVTSCTFSDWQDTNWYVTGHQSGAIKVWHMVHCTDQDKTAGKSNISGTGGLDLDKPPEYRLVLQKVLKFHKHPVTALHLVSDLKQLLSGDSSGHLLSWMLPDESLKSSFSRG